MMSLNTRKQRTVDSAPPNTPTSIDLQAWMYRGIFSYLFRIFPQSRQWAQPKQDPVDRKASRASSSSRLQSLETRLLFSLSQTRLAAPNARGIFEKYHGACANVMWHVVQSDWSKYANTCTNQSRAFFVRGWGSL